ncbi:hypothetical protein SAMN05444339_10252 [Loktanella atrilutea]|uniref:GcrA cell cycle regulator n=1 Tax=Loktanella atrilutea TaxID=366533 RepID=A0A1M4WBQ0_LOKAT|nr:hypothetical protein [Loktanella atrilutea]SHE78392.1 hypothetical protein SAMN05444339_10252 [Loktanella atrilutea]
MAERKRVAVGAGKRLREDDKIVIRALWAHDWPTPLISKIINRPQPNIHMFSKRDNLPVRPRARVYDKSMALRGNDQDLLRLAERDSGLKIMQAGKCTGASAAKSPLPSCPAPYPEPLNSAPITAETPAPRPSIDAPHAASPVWTEARDNALRDTGGRYAQIGELAKKWGMPSSRCISRYHLVRAS